MGIRARGLKGMDSRVRGNDGVVVIPGVIGDPCGPGFPVVAGNDGEGGNDVAGRE